MPYVHDYKRGIRGEANMRYHRLRSHRLLMVWLCVLALATCPSRVVAQTPTEKGEGAVLRVKIWTDRKSYTQGDEVPVYLQVTNISSHDVFIGTDMWTNASFSRVRLDVMPRDGHTLAGENWFVDGLPPHAFDDLPRAVLRWCFSLPPKYSYSADASLQQFVESSDLIPGVYRVVAEYSSSGVDANIYFNPLLGHPEELAKFRAESWTGEVFSNVITVRITPSNVERKKRRD